MECFEADSFSCTDGGIVRDAVLCAGVAEVDYQNSEMVVWFRRKLLEELRADGSRAYTQVL